MGALFIGNLSSLTSGFFIAEAKFRLHLVHSVRMLLFITETQFKQA